MGNHDSYSDYEYGFMVLFDRGQKRNLPTCATAFAVSFAVYFATFAESLPATLRLWSTKSPANEGTARQPVRTTS
jgi:hypothetical protein